MDEQKAQLGEMAVGSSHSEVDYPGLFGKLGDWRSLNIQAGRAWQEQWATTTAETCKLHHPSSVCLVSAGKEGI